MCLRLCLLCWILSAGQAGVFQPIGGISNTERIISRPGPTKACMFLPRATSRVLVKSRNGRERSAISKIGVIDTTYVRPVYSASLVDCLFA
ncbi:hypothetical protein F4778DRAFT_719743 [Xylariomycetidae sp. FL2044]|nr:hypothetical protein F4778DRAFT_719743 [Xylariomycetidae sp. FL2044]